MPRQAMQLVGSQVRAQLLLEQTQLLEHLQQLGVTRVPALEPLQESRRALQRQGPWKMVRPHWPLEPTLRSVPHRPHAEGHRRRPSPPLL